MAERAGAAAPTDDLVRAVFPTATLQPVELRAATVEEGAYKRNGVVFACVLARMLLFTEARFQYQRMNSGRPGDLYGTRDLAVLEHSGNFSVQLHPPGTQFTTKSSDKPAAKSGAAAD